MSKERLLPLRQAGGVVLGAGILLIILAVGMAGVLTPPHAAPTLTPEVEATPTLTPTPTPTLSAGPATATPTPTPPPAAKAFVPWTLPLPGDQRGYGWAWLSGLYGFAAAADGTFWVGDGPAHLTHYGPAGTRLGELDLTGTVGEIFDIEMAGSDLWLLDYPARGGKDAALLRIHPDGQVVLRQAYDTFYTNYLDLCLVKGLCGLVLGGGGELLLDMGGHPLLLADAAGNVQDLKRGEALSEYPGWPHRYATELVLGAAGPTNEGRVTVDGNPITVTMSSPIQALAIVAVLPDGSFYLAAGEGEGTIDGVNFTLFYYGPEGYQRWAIHLVDRANYGIVLHRLAVGPAGAIYFLTPGGPGQAEVHRVSGGDPPTDPPPTLVPPTTTPLPPTETPTPPWTLDRLTSEAAAIVEVETAQGYSAHDRGWEAFKVLRWLKEPPITQGRGIVTPEVLGVSLLDADPPDQWPGSSHFVLFIQLRAGWCEDWPDFYTVLGGPEGIFPVQDARIGATALPGYAGWSLAQFEAAIGPAPTHPASTPVADAAFQQLVQLVDRAPMIAEGDLSWGEPGAGMAFYSLKVQKWYKKPADITKETIGTQTDTCSAHRIGLGSAHFITFLGSPPHGNINAVFGVTDGVVEYGPIGHYWGWPVEKFEAELQAALALPYQSSLAMQQLLTGLVRDSDQIVRVTGGGASPTVKVVEWLKPAAQPAGTELKLHESLDYDQYAEGTYLLFLTEQQKIVRLNDGATFGIFPLDGDTVGWGGIADYQGWPLAAFEDAIRTTIAATP